MTVQYEPFIRAKKKGADGQLMHDAKKKAEIDGLDRQFAELKARDEEWKARDEAVANGEAPKKLSFVDYNDYDDPDLVDDYPELVGQGFSEDGTAINLGVGGIPNFTQYRRYIDGVGRDSLLDERSSTIAPEVRSTDFEVGWGPSDSGIGASYDPRGSGVNSRSYGVPIPYVPQVVKNLRKYDGGEYSTGYKNSFALALLAAIGLADGTPMGGVDWSQLPEYAAASQLMVGRDVEGKPTEYIPYSEIVPKGKQPRYTHDPNGGQVFSDWFNAAMRAQGYDSAERLEQFREPLNRAMFVMRMMNDAWKGNDEAKDFLEKLKLHTSRRKYAWKRGRPDIEEKENKSIETMFKYAPTPVSEYTITSPIDLDTLLTAALKGELGGMSLGKSIVREVSSDLRSSDATAPVSVKELGEAASSYNNIRRMLTPIAGVRSMQGIEGAEGSGIDTQLSQQDEAIKRIQDAAYLNAIKEKAVYYSTVGARNGSPLVTAHGKKLQRIADALENGTISDADVAYLDRMGLSKTPETILAQLLGSAEAAKIYSEVLQLGEDGDSVMDYFMPRADMARKYGADSEEDVDDLTRSQRGLYLRHLVNSLRGELGDIFKGNNVVANKYSGHTPTPWEYLRYAIHRAPTDNTKYHAKELDDGQETIKEVWGKKYTDPFSVDDEQDISAADREKGQWSWRSPDILDMLTRIRDEGVDDEGNPMPISDKDAELLRLMGFLREGHLLGDYTPDRIRDAFRKYRGNKSIDASDEDLMKSRNSAILLAKLDDILTAASEGDLELDGEDLKQVVSLAKKYAQTLEPTGFTPLIVGKLGAEQNARRKKIEELIKKYTGNDMIREIGMKNFDEDTVDDLSSNKLDVFRYLDEGEKSMTRPQTYASNILNMDKYLANVQKINESKNEIRKLERLRNGAMRDGDEEEIGSYNKRISSLEEDIAKKTKQNQGYMHRLDFGNSVISFDQNSAKVDKDKLTEESARRYAKELADREGLDENDQFLTGVDKLLAILTDNNIDYTDEWDDMMNSLLYEGTDPLELAKHTYPDVKDWGDTVVSDNKEGWESTIEHNVPELLAMRDFIYDYVNGQGAKVANDALSQTGFIKRKKKYRVPKQVKVPYVAVKEPMGGNPAGGGHGLDLRRPDFGVTLSELVDPRHLYDNNGMGVSLPKGVENREVTEYITKVPSAASVLPKLYGDNLENVPELEPWLSLPDSDEFMDTLRYRKYFPWISDSYKGLGYLSEEEADKQRELMRRGIINLAKAMLKKAPKLSRKEYNSVFKSMSAIPILRKKKLKDA